MAKETAKERQAEEHELKAEAEAAARDAEVEGESSAGRVLGPKANFEGSKPSELVPPGTNIEEDEEGNMVTSEASGESSGSSDEFPPPVTGGFVRLSLDSENVPEEVRGHLAAIMDVPVRRVDPLNAGDDPRSPRGFDENPEDFTFTVKTRDQYGLMLQITSEDVEEFSPSGRMLPI